MAVLNVLYKNFYLNAITFCQLVETGSFTGVAKKMDVSQPTITRRIAALEEELNLILIKRNTKQVTITSDGQNFYELFATQENQLVKALQVFKDKTLHNNIKINLSLPTGIANHIISPHITAFIDKYPNLTLNIFYQNREIDLVKEQIDLAVVRKIPKLQTVKIKKIHSHITHLYCTPQYTEKHGLPTSLEDLINNHSVVGGLQDDSSMYSKFAIDEDGNTTDISHIVPRLNINTLEPALLLAKRGDIIIGGTDLMYKEQLSTGELVKVLPSYYFSGSEFFLVRLDGAHHPLLEELMQFIQDCFNPQ